MKNEEKHPQIPVCNPTDDDFTITYDLDEDGKGESWTLHAGEIEEFPLPVATHIKKHFAEQILFKEGWAKSNPDLKRAEILKRLEVKYDN